MNATHQVSSWLIRYRSDGDPLRIAASGGVLREAVDIIVKSVLQRHPAETTDCVAKVFRLSSARLTECPCSCPKALLPSAPRASTLVPYPRSYRTGTKALTLVHPDEWVFANLTTCVLRSLVAEDLLYAAIDR